MDHRPAVSPRLSRWAMALSLACFLVYAFNVLAGKANIALRWSLPRLGDVSEFLVVLACVTLFVVALIAGEAASEPPRPEP